MFSLPLAFPTFRRNSSTVFKYSYEFQGVAKIRVELSDSRWNSHGSIPRKIQSQVVIPRNCKSQVGLSSSSACPMQFAMNSSGRRSSELRLELSNFEGNVFMEFSGNCDWNCQSPAIFDSAFLSKILVVNIFDSTFLIQSDRYFSVLHVNPMSTSCQPLPTSCRPHVT